MLLCRNLGRCYIHDIALGRKEGAAKAGRCCSRGWVPWMPKMNMHTPMASMTYAKAWGGRWRAREPWGSRQYPSIS